ncbi:hypothetical protein QTO34_014379 [Cnephaeus nilssonii]|uniref:ST3 beta-galactoside alpha-2,3-sialyltransferase 6 n=1 Tax=Cnephaeus nilssonii TaxID=3371016 RepID=A0AA40I696_CNENI|nr:hypothetical protein QTO34_014379 [Eptesicus nilssonii]
MEKPSGMIKAGSHCLHPLMAPSDQDWHWTLAAAEYFRLALSKLQSCDLFDEFDKWLNLSLVRLPNSVPCKRCVVVGNGGVLKNKTLGERIDSYDVIISLKLTDLLDKADRSGEKPSGNGLRRKRQNTNGFWKKPALNLIYKPYQIRILDPFIIRTAAYELLNFPKVFPKNQKPKHPTTGIIAITLAFHICHEVHLAGFRYNFSDLKSPLHYYGNATMSLMNKNAYHNVTAEQLFLKDIIEKNFVINLTQD